MVLLDPNVWGPKYWFFLNTVALTYPNNPNAITKRTYYNLIQNFHLFIPVEEYSKTFEELLKLYPIKTYLDDKESLIRWTHFIHNKINESLEKPQLNYSNFFIKYYEQYKSQNVAINQYKSIIKQVLYISIIICLLIISLKNKK